MLSFAKPVFKTFLRDFTLLKKVVVDQTMKLFSRPNNVIVWRISILVTLEELYWKETLALVFSCEFPYF